MISALCVISLGWLIHAYLFFEKIVVPSFPKLHPCSRKSHELNCCTVYTYIERWCVCIYVTTHTHVIYFDCCSLYLLDVIFWKARGGVGWESHGTLSCTVVSWGKGRRGAIVGSSKSSWKDLHRVFGHCFLLLLQLSERNTNL